MADGRAGDRVNLNQDDTNPAHSGELIQDLRFDLPDAAALQELIQATLVRQLGGLMGFGSGCAGRPTLTLVGLSLQIGSCLLFDGQQVGTNQEDGRFIRHTRAGTYQGTSDVDLTPYQAASDLAVVWARRFEAVTDQDIRKRYNTATGAEGAFAPNIRRRENIQFTTTINSGVVPAAGSGEPYFPIARVTQWAVGVPTVLPIMMWDGLLNNLSITGVLPTKMDTFVGAGTDAGLIRTLYTMRLIMALMADSTLGTNWQSVSPARGLLQLEGDLTAAEASVANLLAETVPASFVLLAAGYVDWTGAVYNISAAFGSKNVTSGGVVGGGAGVITITPTSLAGVSFIASGTAHGANVTPRICNVTPTISGCIVRIFDVAGTPIDDDFTFTLWARRT